MSSSEELDKTGNLFVAYLAKYRRTVEVYLEDEAPHALRTSQLYDDLDRYLYAPLRHFTARGGKRTRPVLCLLGCEAVGGRPEAALSPAFAVEYFQSAALVHDDIADDGQLRRGKPCLHLLEGTGPAINDGDLGIVTTFQAILHDESLDAKSRLSLLEELAHMEHMTVEGQALDLCWVRDERGDITPDDYLYMAWHKTAYYSAACPLAMGAVCGGGSPAQVKALRAYGLDTGLAFQIQDDLLNLVGDATAQGKDFRSDITEGKRTLGVVWALQELKGAERDELLGILKAHTTDQDQLARAVELMEHAGAINHMWSEAVSLVQQAKARLPKDDFDPEAYDVLLSMADFFVRRAG